MDVDQFQQHVHLLLDALKQEQEAAQRAQAMAKAKAQRSGRR